MDFMHKVFNVLRFIKRIQQITKQAPRSGVIAGIGGFSGLYSLDASRYEDPVLATSTDGVGTKVKIASMMGKHDTIGIDLVAMCVNDIAVEGAKPLFFHACSPPRGLVLCQVSSCRLDTPVRHS